MAEPSTKSEMARSSECTEQYAQKVLDTADFVRDACSRQLQVDMGSTDANPCVRPSQTRSELFLLYDSVANTQRRVGLSGKAFARSGNEAGFRAFGN